MKNQTSPLVSFSVITYNHEKYIEEALESIINQTFKNFEVVIVNDGSTDNTDKIIRQFIEKYPDYLINYINQENQGPSSATNTAILNAKGKYIAFMSGDDVCYYHRLERQLKFVEETDAKIVFSWVDFIDDDSNIIQGEHFASNFFNHPHRTREEILRYFFFNGNYINAITGLIERELLIEAGLFLTTSIQLQDFDMWLKLAKKYDIYMLPEKLIKYRIISNNGNLSSPTMEAVIRSDFEIRQIYKTFFDDFSPNLFNQTFSAEIKLHNFSSPQEYEIEKALIFLAHTRPSIQLIGIEKLFNLLQDAEILEICQSKYHFSMFDFYELTNKFDFRNTRQVSYLSSQLLVQSSSTQDLKIKKSLLFSIILPVYNPKEKYLREAIASVINQTYPHWELCIADDASTKPYVREMLTEYAYKDNRIKVVFRQENGHISKASNTALEIATGEYIALLDHDDILAPNALYEVAKLLNEHPEADMIYTDEALLNDQYICKKMFCKPDWCPDSFLSHMYTCHLGVYRRSLIQEIGGFRVGYEGSQDYDLVLRLTEKTDKIFHIPKLLYYWRQHSGSVTSENYQVKAYAYKAAQKALEDALKRRKEKGIVIPHENYLGTYKTRYEIIDYDLVSIIIPTRDLADILDRCLESIFNKTTYPKYEIILLDNGSKENETFAVFDKWKKQQPDKFYCYRYDVPFNYSHINNYAVTKAKGKYLLFLNNDTEVITPDWINAMVEQAQRQSIGAVGAYLKYPDNTMQHTGVILGRGILAANEHIYHDKTLNFSAVTGACLMCRRDVFVEVGGFDEDLAVAFNDVDLCLKIREQGYYNICLPHVLLYHHESKTRGYEDTPEKIARFEKEAQFMRDKWGELVEQDPCISPAYLGNPKKHQQVSANFTVIVTWWDHTEFLELWQNNLKILKDAEIIFIDNGSQEESKKALAEFCQKHSLKLIRNEENLGFSATNNQGLKKATKEYILHLNNDISINYLPFVYLAYLAENGIVGPGPAKNELNVSYVEGWGLCAKKSVLENLGGWDEEFDDQDWAILDLCHRAKLAGYPLFSVPQMRKWFLPVS